MTDERNTSGDDPREDAEGEPSFVRTADDEPADAPEPDDGDRGS